MTKLSFDKFIKKIFIRATMAEIYNCWASGHGLCTWFLEKAEYYRNGDKLSPETHAKTGDTYLWKWYNWDPEEQGKVLEANGEDRFCFSFAGECEVLVELNEFQDGTIISLTQSKIPTDEDSKLKIHVGCSNGWTFWMSNLKAYLEHGVLLHETQIDLSKNPLAPWEFINI